MVTLISCINDLTSLTMNQPPKSKSFSFFRVLVCLLGIFFCLLLLLKFTLFKSYPVGYRVAKYKDFQFTSSSSYPGPENPKKEYFTTMKSGGVEYSLADFYLELPNGKRYLLSELPEEEIEKTFKRIGKKDDIGLVTYRSDDSMWGQSFFNFYKGKLSCVVINGGSATSIPFSLKERRTVSKTPH